MYVSGDVVGELGLRNIKTLVHQAFTKGNQL